MAMIRVNSTAIDNLGQQLNELINKCYAHIIKEINKTFNRHAAENADCNIDEMIKDLDTIIATKSLQTKDFIKLEINKLRSLVVPEPKIKVAENLKVNDFLLQ